jgi:ribosomal protein S27E
VESASSKLCGTVIGAPVGAEDAGDTGYSHDVAPLRADHLGKERFYNLQFPKEKESQCAHESCVFEHASINKG